MREVKRHFKRGKELDAQKKKLEAGFEEKIGRWVIINYNNHQDIYNFHTKDYIGVIKLAKLLGLKSDMQHVLSGDEDFPNTLIIKELYDGQDVEIFCIATDKEYREGFAKHERVTSKNN